MLCLIFRHSRHCTIPISIKNVLKILKTIVLYAVFDLSTLKTLYHSYSMCKLLYAVFDLSTLKTFYHSYIYLKCIFRHSRHCTIPISIKNASFDTQDIVPDSYSMCKLLYAVFDLSTLKTLYHSYIYLKCIF